MSIMTGSSKSKATLVLIPSPAMGHLVPVMELAKMLVARDTRLTVTVLLIKLPVTNDKLDTYLLSLKSDPSLKNGVVLIEIPVLDNISYKEGFLSLYIDHYQFAVKEVVDRLRDGGLVGGLILDLFCTGIFDVADNLGIPSYLFFTSGANLLSVFFRLRGLGVDILKEYDVVRSPDTTLEFLGFRNPVPVRFWPGVFLEKQEGSGRLCRTDTFRRAKGILVNTFTKLEGDLIRSLSQDGQIPSVIPVGPLLNLARDGGESSSSEVRMMRWLDAQPLRSVVFLCFGSVGSFDDTQVKEIAAGLECSGRRFLWSLCIQPENKFDTCPTQDDPRSVLPEGFLERTEERGMVIGWAPQTRILGHVAVGDFVSHCGWNSILESLWYGVPIIVWPIYAEQQLNAFYLVKELGLATEIRIDYRQDFGINMVIGAKEVEEGIRKATTTSTSAELVRKKVKEMSEEARKAVREGGSSYESVGQFIQGVLESLC